MVHTASAYARTRNRLSTLRLHDLHRPGRDQHGHRRGAGHRQPAAGAAAARRRLRHPGRRPGAAGAGGHRAVRRLRQRRVPPGVAVLRPGQPARAAARRRCSARCGCSPTRPRPARSRSRCRRTCRPRRTTGRRSCSPSRVWHVAPAGARAGGRWPRPVELIRGARRPLIVAGGGVIYSEAHGGAARVRRGDRHPGRGDPGGQGLAAATTTRSRSARSASTGTTGGQRPRPRGRRGHRHRHPLQRLHHRLAQRRSPTRTCGSSTSTWRAFDAAKHAGAAVVGRRPAGAGWRCTARWTAGRSTTPYRTGPRGWRPEWDATVERDVRRWRAATTELPTQARGARRSSTRCRRRATSWCARPARCPATCTSCGAPGTRRATTSSTATPAWATRSPAGSASRLAAPDREVFVMVGDGSYLMMAQELVTAVQEGIKLIVVLVQNHGFASIGALSESARRRSGSARLPLPRPATGGSTATCCRSTWPPTPRASAPTCCAREQSAELRDALHRAADADAHHRRPRRVPTPRRHAVQRVVVGRPGQRGLGALIDADA